MTRLIVAGGRLFGLLQGLAGLFLVGNGAQLLARGGSAYYLLAGLILLGVALGCLRGKAWGGWLYQAFLAGTIGWALWETGADFWPFYARTFLFLVMGIPAGLLLAGLAGGRAPRRRLGGLLIAGIEGLGALAMLLAMFQPHDAIRPDPALPPLAQPAPSGAIHTQDWAHYGNTPEGERHADADQITRANVASLRQAWVYHTGDIPRDYSGTGSEDQNTPLFVAGTVYVCTPHNTVIALDGDTGAERWKYRIDVGDPKKWVRCRGLGYADSAALPAAARAAGPAPGHADCPRRIFVNTARARLLALDAQTGRPCADFGEGGTVDLTAGIGKVPADLYKPTSGPTVAGRVVVVGSYVNDNVSTDMPSGVVRAYDVRDGRLVWAFDTGRPEDHGPPRPGTTYTRGSPNVWAPMSYDPATNLVFLPTGNASPDIWGGNRTPAEDRFSSSVVALDAATGRLRWSFQTVHHDLWDYDVPMQPTLTAFPAAGGRLVPAVVFGTKLGQIYVLDRATGRPLTRVEERPVPAGTISGERYAPRQPLSTGMPAIGTQTLREADMWGMTPFDQLLCRIAFRGMRYTGLFDPPGLDRSLTFPGALGGMNWGGVSVDPRSHTLFVNDLRLAQWYQLFPRRPGVADDTLPFPMSGAPVSLEKGRFFSVFGVPCQKPPYGTMTAIDLATRKIRWQIPLGTIEDTGPLGIRTGLPLPIGMPTIGGSLSTGGGLVFFAGTQDYYLRALDSASGRELWKQRLPVGSQGGPMTYVSPRTGTQYVLITAGGARQSPDRGDYVIAYKLQGR
ncbi:MAG TPA: membrane-bound PQQ-dependent dehydrogenase, glucose/quinate/shikimate family [Novosphingobium sp.]|nr:membrane-bound PQQ-dependent dehydrogenase, glucose/quinate/shikimate family [Novosphingobium sp.]